MMWLETLSLALITHAAFHFLEHRTLAIPMMVLLIGPPLTLIWTQNRTPSISQAIQFYAQYFGLLLSSVVGYRLSPLHPLWSFPGPALGKVTKLYGVWLSWTGKQYLVIQKLHVQYGTFVRVGPNDISIVEEEAVSSVLGVGGLSKGRYYEVAEDPNAPSTLLMLHGEAHANRRRIWNRGMSNDSLKEYETLIADRASQLGDQLSKRLGEVVDLSQWISCLTMDIMGDMAFGGGFETLQGNQDSTDVQKSLERFTHQITMMTHIPWAAPPFVQKIPLISADMIAFRGFAASKALKRIQSASLKKDLWYHLSDDANLEKKRPAVEEVVGDAVLAIVAGSDTTAFVLTALFFLLLSHPEVYSKLQAEIDQVYPTEANPFDANKHDEMPYLKACLNETLRMYPPVLTNGPREVDAGAERVIAGRFIPPRTQIYLPIYSYHHDSRFFPNPDNFLPERWLSTSKEPITFMPFSYGPANCAGRNLAKKEMMMALSFLLQNFSFSPATGVESSSWKMWPDTLGDHFVASRGGLRVCVTRRNR